MLLLFLSSVIDPRSSDVLGAEESFILETADARSLTGPLEGLDETWSVRLGGTQPVRIPGDDVLSLRRAEVSLPAPPLDEQVIFANGDRLPGKVLGLSGERLRLESLLGGDQELKLPLATLSIIWIAASDGVEDSPGRQIRRLMVEQRRRDVVHLRNGDVVEGTLTALDRKTLGLQEGGEEVQIDFNKVAAIALNTQLARRPSSAKVYGHLVLSDGGRLALASAQADAQTLTGKTFFGSDIQAPLDQIVALDLRQGRSVYLSDLKPRDYHSTSYLGDEGWPYENHVSDGSVAGNDIVLAGSTYDKGLGMRSESRLTYDLAPGYRRFEALVGLDDNTGREGRVRIKVLVDGKVQDIGGDHELSSHDGPEPIRVNVVGARELTIVVEFGRRGPVQGHVDWADARLIK